jgi:hypothetical protein
METKLKKIVANCEEEQVIKECSVCWLHFLDEKVAKPAQIFSVEVQSEVGP